MKTLEVPTLFHDYPVPRTDKSALIDPPLSAAGDLLQRNRQRSEAGDLSFAGISFRELRRRARADVLQAAMHYTSRYRDYSGPADPNKIVMAGHQPQLFHPGVWFKNFALSKLTQAIGATPINLVVDNDLRGSGSIRVPTRSKGGAIQASAVAYDDPGLSVPLEQHRIGNRALFDSFDQRVASTVAPFVSDPCVFELWGHARAAADRCENTGCALASARHALEGSLGLQTLELPLSVVCRTPAFAAFLVGLISDLPRLHDCYNASVLEYRQAHGIRSSAHPVPLLGAEDEWLEAPLWMYGDDQPERRAVWVRAVGGQWEISDRDQVHVRLDDRPDDPRSAEQLFALQSSNLKLRPRALITTMYSRLILSDLFLHGIGGGKYDQLGDMIVRHFFGIEPPRFMVLSATALLPGATVPGDGAAVRQLRKQLRDTRFNPQRFADRVALPAECLQERADLLNRIPPQGHKWTWHRQLEAVTERLASRLEPVRQEIRERLAEVLDADRQQQILASRDHPFCLYPLDYLTPVLEQMLD